MYEDEDINLFEGISFESGDFVSHVLAEDGDAGDLPEEEALRRMPPEELIQHALRVQEMCRIHEGENRFLNWELREYKDSLTYFSGAAKLAHRLSASDVETVASVAIHELPDYFNCTFGALFFFDTATGLFELYRSSSPAPASLRPYHVNRDAEHFMIRLLTSNTRPFIAEYFSEDGLIITDSEEHFKAEVSSDWREVLGDRALVLPLQIASLDGGERTVLGGLLIGSCQRDLVVKDAEIAIMFADLLSSSLYNARLLQRLNELSIIDPLTQIYNRRHLISHLNSAIVQARRYGHKLALAMLDIDHFKGINDACGHLYGDEVLRNVAAMLCESVRSDVDLAARYGGEEFILLMPYTSLENACEVAERVRNRIASHRFVCEERNQEFTVTCSIGVAEFMADESLERFIDRADSALYDAKNQGRNRVCPMPASRAGQ